MAGEAEFTNSKSGGSGATQGGAVAQRPRRPTHPPKHPPEAISPRSSILRGFTPSTFLGMPFTRSLKPGANLLSGCIPNRSLPRLEPLDSPTD